MEIAQFVSMLKDIVLGVAAIVTATAALRGINKWRQELEGKAQFDAARGLTRATYKLRNEIRKARGPIIWGHEFPDDYSPGTSVAEEARAYGHAYQNRWNPVMAAVTEFESQVLEAEALWGEAVRSRADALMACAKKYNLAVATFMDDKRSGGVNFGMNPEFGRETRAMLQATPEDDANPLNIEIKTAVLGIEDLLRPHLRRGG